MSMELADDVGFDDPADDASPAPTAIDKRQSGAINADITRVQTQLAEFDRVSAGLAAIEAQYPIDAVYDVTTTKGMDAAKEHRAAYRDPRILVEKARKSAKAPILTLGKSIDQRAAWITERLIAGEEPVHLQIKAEEDRREQVRQDKINAEAGRVMAIQEALAGIGQDVLIACGKASADIQALIDRMTSTQPDPLVFQEQIDQARAAWSAALVKLDTALKAKRWEEAEAKRIADERAAEEARRVAEQERLARVAAEQAEAARVLAEERAQLASERAELEALRAAQVPAPVPPAPVPEPAPAPVDPVVQDPPPVFDRAGDEFAEPHMQASLETTEADARPAAPEVVRAALAQTLPAHRVETDLLALAELFVTRIMEARGPGERFPSHPKPSREWWDGTFEQGEQLLAQIGAAA
ncbi:hypothetical protein [Rhizobacter sp. OV335]|uniref:hypothetical protein n=1 Tax=Rhizobacter sp. OV335 TaxID=1500264 RepID=UPI000919899D|nr:hypothetical protein [Rhizobacter sp. OV335]SHN40416.1 hypothetical protein SAMN02787076_06245 [Rhizobacter sp. OV335]